jgi:dihydrofolate synthase/folylpolyglutamate synthase
MDLSGTVMTYGDYKDIKIPLLGEYQVFNASNVLTCVDILKENGISINDESVMRGLLKTKWPARFEIISESPLVIADGGHNPQGVEGAVNSVKRYFGNEKLYVISGVMADKDVAYMTDRISEVADAVFCLTPDNPRALPAAEYASLYQARGISAKAFPTVRNALSAAVTWAKETGRPLVSLGSLYMYGEIRQALKTIQ